MRQRPCSAFCLLALGFALALPASAQEDTGPATPTFKEGDVISIDKIESLKPFLPPEFWSNRDFFFYEGMKLEVGPFYRDYTPSDAYVAASQKFAGQAKVGPGQSLQNFTAGVVFVSASSGGIHSAGVVTWPTMTNCGRRSIGPPSSSAGSTA
jgi:hypothetical protein